MVTLVDESLVSSLKPSAQGLDLTVAAGKVRMGNQIQTVMQTTLTLPDNQTTYVFIDSSGGVDSSTTGFPPNNAFYVAIVTTAGGEITDLNDCRTIFSA